MPIRPEGLRALVAGASPQKPKRIPLPSAPEAVYAGPNPDGSRKRCGNCYKFVADGSCVEVAGRVEEGAVCNLHVFGRPQTLPPPFGPRPKLGAVDAGLIPTPGGDGTSCDLCRFYKPSAPDVGLCEALADAMQMPPAAVEPLGCCSRWSPQSATP